MDAEDRELLGTSVAAALDATAAPTANDAALGELGWHDMLGAEPIDAVAVVFGRMGAAAADATLIDDVVAAALGLDPGAAIVHPRWGVDVPEERGATPTIGTVTGRVASATDAFVVARDAVAAVAVDRLAVDAPAADRRLSNVVVTAPLVDVVVTGPEAVDAAVVAARHAIAHQLHGLAGGMLALARQHAVDRKQFGRPIGAFQAVRHRLAETHVAIEAAADALAAADDDPTPLTVDLARVLAGRAAIDAGRHCQQVLAGIGFTRDHDFHRYLFAAIELDGLYGTTTAITRHLGRRLIHDGTVPRAVDL